MNKPISLTLLVVGTILVIYGIATAGSFGPDVARFFTRAATDRAMWLLIGGAIVAINGLAGVIGGTKT